MKLALTALNNFPLVIKSDNLADIIVQTLSKNNMDLENNDIIVMAQKIVSKSEGRQVNLADVNPSQRAVKLAALVRRDPRLVELILSESKEIVRNTAGCEQKGISGHLITKHRLGYIMANSGIDQSNIVHGETSENALLLPLDPDQSCRTIRSEIYRLSGVSVGIIINDSWGRPWRNGVVGMCIGAAGLPTLVDMRGKLDLFGRVLQTTQIAIADEISAAASLIMGQAGEGRPVVHVRGLMLNSEGTGLDLIRPPHEELFN